MAALDRTAARPSWALTSEGGAKPARWRDAIGHHLPRPLFDQTHPARARTPVWTTAVATQYRA
ncbi:MAG: hypothetical protein ACRD0J_06620, partial [Acidimicrobiales bacterium]